MKSAMKQHKLLIGICVLIFALGIIGSAWQFLRPHGTLVNIVQDNAVLYTIDLDSTNDQVFSIEYQGRTNTIQIQDGKIRVLDADCHDKTCVHMGWLTSMPIVCLPNHLAISFIDQPEKIDTTV